MAKLAAIVFSLLVLLTPAGLRAEDKPAAELPARVTTHHEITLAGQSLCLRRDRRNLRTDRRQGRGHCIDLHRLLSGGRNGRRRAAGDLRLQRRSGRGLGIPASGGARSAYHGDAGQRRGTRPAGAADRQSGDLAGVHRPRLYRSGRHRLQPRRRQGGEPGQAVLGRACRPHLARRGDPALADPASALVDAGLSRRRELRRISRRGIGAGFAARCRT